MKYILAGLILAIWTIMVIGLSWDQKTSALYNVLAGILFVGFFGMVYWVPFWLIFLL